MTNEEHLAVLDKTHEEQLKWCVDNAGLDIVGESLADLAFRLRDEVSETKGNLMDIFNPTKLTIAYFDAFMDICDHYKYPWSENQGDVYTWIVYNAKPIHWIIAALIAKREK